MNTINNGSTFFSTVLGEVAHPINIIREYRRVLPKSAARIVTALDGWVRTHQKDPKKYSAPEWVYAPAENLAKQIDLCRDTVQRWLTWLVEQGYLIREWARRWPTDRAYKYRIADKLWSAMQFERYNSQPFSFTDENQAMDSRKPNDGQPTSQQSMPQKPAISYINLKSTEIPTNQEGWPACASEEEEAPQASGVIPKAQTTSLASQQTSLVETNVPLIASSKPEIDSPASVQTVTVSAVVARPQETNLTVVARPQETNLTEEVRDRLAGFRIPLDKKVVEAIEKHHISQVYAALGHIEATWETIENPRGVFLFQLPKQPIEKLGSRLPFYTAEDAPGIQVEPSEPPTGFFDSLRKKFGRK
ncbi:helix-turn-helix domain-containing protein [Laspinema olomoucense]|uniref:helix-turn-helix domain-containing protein n=1 Tax=Laspinema olomoucense TaxID=3231600 RepID=UPI0021BB4807|nr:helix-turn-helix domain-containing protein [Laspinema sp. D3d]MCT7975244.1 helix-turn-helix domain-containing protein [Laspinema sp. D3d]